MTGRGVGVQKGPKWGDVISEQPLIYLTIVGFVYLYKFKYCHKYKVIFDKCQCICQPQPKVELLHKLYVCDGVEVNKCLGIL